MFKLGLLLVLVSALTLAACGPAVITPQATATPSPPPPVVWTGFAQSVTANTLTVRRGSKNAVLVPQPNATVSKTSTVSPGDLQPGDCVVMYAAGGTAIVIQASRSPTSAGAIACVGKTSTPAPGAPATQPTNFVGRLQSVSASSIALNQPSDPISITSTTVILLVLPSDLSKVATGDCIVARGLLLGDGSLAADHLDDLPPDSKGCKPSASPSPSP